MIRRRRPGSRVQARMLEDAPGYVSEVRTTTSPHDSVRERNPGAPGEPEHKRLSRNLNELLQELRVTQTGVQILTGFLLTLPFSDRFAELTAIQRHVYLAVLCGSVVSTGMILHLSRSIASCSVAASVRGSSPTPTAPPGLGS